MNLNPNDAVGMDHVERLMHALSSSIVLHDMAYGIGMVFDYEPVF